MILDDHDSPASSSDDDDDEILNKERERRFAEIKDRAANAAAASPRTLYGRLEELSCEQDLMQAALHCPRLVAHLHRPDFRRCQKMAEALSCLAKLHPTVRFVQVEAVRAPFLTAKWGIRVLPCVVRIDDREAVDRVVGFEGVMAPGREQDGEEPDLKLLEERLVK